LIKVKKTYVISKKTVMSQLHTLHLKILGFESVDAD